ncbi:MAG: hypothetical protein K6G81_07590 [Lachnospiraceae bacterium]|nr:hypothetical protein [Lachnospiraceae bacterium]
MSDFSGRLKKVHLAPADCAVDMGDGSERGLYVDQEYILNKLHRPHRAISIMYCYYPLDEAWPKRAQEAYADRDVKFAWDYPYDNYFPYMGGIGGSTDGEPFNCMKDIRSHGQEVILTLTVDPKVSDEHIIGIAKDLRPYGRMMLRMNHECTGSWFSFNKRASYQQIADFFVRFSKIMKEYAPNVRMILCAGSVMDKNRPKLEKEEEFMEAGRATDIWSMDRYIGLNWGWPYEVAEKTNGQHKLEDTALNYEMSKLTYKRYCELYGIKKPFVMSELNADGDVTGPFKQADIIRDFYMMFKNDPEKWASAITLYQFRDDGRLGLEFTNPSDKQTGIEWPLMDTYREIIHDPFFMPKMEEGDEIAVSNDTQDGKKSFSIEPVKLRWGSLEDSDGVSMELDMEKNPVFAEANFPEELADANLMLEINGHWFHKAKGARFVDFMPAFYINRLTGPCKVSLNIFAPPADGVNDPSQGDDWAENYYYELKALPDIRLRFEPVC